MPEREVKILYIMGWGRSGSTILDNLLGELDGFFSMGELHYFWERNVLGGRSCGCGRPIVECPVWSKVVAAVDATEAERIVRWQNEAVRIRHTWKLLRSRPGSLDGSPALKAYVDVTARLNAAVADVTGTHVLVDSSKRPSDAALLEFLPGVEPFYVHLVRDPRAVAYSWKRRKALRDAAAPAEMVPHGTVDSAVNWVMWNLAAGAVRRRSGKSRSMLLRYEDFVLHPRDAVAAIAKMLGEDGAELPFEGDRTVRLGTNHTVSGNPSRFTTGTVEIRPDEEWISGQRPVDRWVTTALTLPLLPRYRYPLVPRAASASS